MTSITSTPLAVQVPGPGAEHGPRSNAANPGAGVDRAWQLEMEKAQTRDWFHPSLGPQAKAGEHRLASAAEGPAAGAALHSAQAPSPFVAAPAQSTLAAAPAAGTLRIASTAHALALRNALPVAEPASIAAALWAAPPGTAREDAPSHAAPQRLQPRVPLAVTVEATPSSVHAESSAPRLHVEESPEGLRVWVGLSGDMASVAVQRQALVAELRRDLASQGQSLALVVCNGEIVFNPSGGGAAPPDSTSTRHGH